MFHRILVPLDGSTCAERAIPVAGRIAQHSQGSVVFVRVVLPSSELGEFGVEADITVEPTILEKHLFEAEKYLAAVTVTATHTLEGIPVETDVVVGAPSPTLFSETRLEQVDLIVMCSRGNTGLKRWIFKSVAQQAVRCSPVPVLVLNEHEEEDPLSKMDHPLRVIVPLDGSKLAEAALEPVVQLAAGLSSSAQKTLHLLSVVQVVPRNSFDIGTAYIDGEILAREQREAQAYLEMVAKRLREGPLASSQMIVTTLVVVSDEIPRAIIKEAERINDASGDTLIAIATHGRKGLERLLMGSMTEHILGATTLPLLVVRPQMQTANV